MRSVIKILSALLAMVVLSSCATGGEEPRFVPTVYVTDPNKCEVVNSENKNDVVKPPSKRWNELYCAPVWDLYDIEKKFQECKVWK